MLWLRISAPAAAREVSKLRSAREREPPKPMVFAWAAAFSRKAVAAAADSQ